MAGAPSRRDLALVIVAATAFATSGPLGKVCASYPALATASARTGIAALVLGLASPRELVSSLLSLSSRQRLAVLLAGVLLGAHFALFLAGLAETSLVAAVSLISLEPLSVVLAAFLVFGLRPSRQEAVGLVLATVGALVVASAAGTAEHRMVGDAQVLGSVVLYGVYVAVARGLRDAMPANAYATAVYGTASLVLLPFALPAALGAVPPSRAVVASILGLALVPTLIGHTLVQRAARTAPPAVVALVSPGETVGSLAIGALVLGTLPSGREGMGASLVILGATIAILAKTRKAGHA